MTKALLVFALLFSLPAIADTSAKWDLSASDLTYKVVHTLHTVEGKSIAAKGKGNCDASSCKFLIAVPVKTFDSGDSNRDLHMIEVTKGALHPMIIANARTPLIKPGETKKLLIDFDIEFAGKKSVYSQVPFDVESRGDKTVSMHGVIPLKMSDFSVERPALLTVPIKDEVPITVNATWQVAAITPP